MDMLTILPKDMIKPSDDRAAVLAFIGGGGKTTTIMNLAKALKSSGYKVAVTTTTKIYAFDGSDFEHKVFDGKNELSQDAVTVLYSSVNSEGKLVGLSSDDVESIARESGADFVLVEADGSKGRSLKGHGANEPVIPPGTDRCFIVMGLDAAGSAVSEDTVHRPEIFAGIVGRGLGDIISSDDYVSLLFKEGGYVSRLPAGIGYTVLLTKRNRMDEGELHSLVSRIGAKCEIHVI